MNGTFCEREPKYLNKYLAFYICMDIGQEMQQICVEWSGERWLSIPLKLRKNAHVCYGCYLHTAAYNTINTITNQNQNHNNNKALLYKHSEWLKWSDGSVFSKSNLYIHTRWKTLEKKPNQTVQKTRDGPTVFGSAY